MEDVKRLCTDARAAEFDKRLIPILPHLSELKMLTSTKCLPVNQSQMFINETYTRKVWLDLLGLILSYDRQARATPQTMKGTLYGIQPKMEAWWYDDGGKERDYEIGCREAHTERLWSTSARDRNSYCKCPVYCAVRPRHSWPHLAPTSKKGK